MTKVRNYDEVMRFYGTVPVQACEFCKLVPVHRVADSIRFCYDERCDTGTPFFTVPVEKL
jgi:hypothetical protein